ncbi:MAG: asparaginase [Bacteroidetes bacterium]|nr:asparaginase [Bacteroidota bacterium]
MDIQIFTTGGTIDKVYFDARSVFQVGEPQVVEILEGANVTVEYTVETLFRKDSLDLTDADRAVIADRVRETPCRRVLITHGTDTMIQTAQVLQDIPEKTIVLVGSLRPARFKRSAAEFNIGFALGAVQALPAGVYIAMNGCLFDPEKVRKNREMNQFEGV